MKQLLTIAFIIFGLCFFACNGPDDGYNYGPAQKYLVKSLDNYFVVPKGEYDREVFRFEDVPEGEEVKFSDITLVVQEMEREYLSWTPGRGQWLPMAMADPAPPSLDHQVTEIEITSDKDFVVEDSTYTPGMNLMGEFLFAEDLYLDFLSAEEVLKGYAQGQSDEYLHVHIRFNSVLVETVDQSFTVTLRFDDGVELSTTTPTIQVI